MKKSILTALFVLSVSSTCYAAPIINYSAEKLSVDIAYQPNLSFGTDADGLDGKSKNIDFGITAALSDKWGLQYVQNDFTSDTATVALGDFSLSENTDIKVKQFNLTYNCNADTVLFVGYTKHNMSYNNSIVSPIYSNSFGYSGESVNGFQIGAIQVVPVNDNLKSYGIFSIGNKLLNIEFGLTQPVSQNIELNLFYKYMKCTDINHTDRDISTQGLGFGMTCKF